VSFGSIASITVPRGGATRDITVTVNWVLYGQVSQAAPQLAATYDVTVTDCLLTRAATPGQRF
jgi:hypothetical protein